MNRGTMSAPDLQLNRPAVQNISKAKTPTCPACESPSRSFLYSVTEHEYTTTTTDAFPLHECTDCGAWYLDPRPDTSTLDIIYPPNYYAHVMEARTRQDSEQRNFRGLYKRLVLATFLRRMKPIVKHGSIGADTTWLDVGCGAGYPMDAMFAAYGTRCTGIDMSAEAVRQCRERGFEAHAARFEDYEPHPGEAYDVVHSSHVIEHVASPLDYMRKAWQLLKPGGLNVFVTPNTATPESRRFGRHWGGLHVPRHWTMFDPRSAKLLGERTGFEHVETSFSTNGAFWTWSFHSRLQNTLPSRWNDRIFPSDHRFIDSNPGNLARASLFALFDLATLAVSRQSANMLCIFRKPGA